MRPTDTNRSLDTYDIALVAPPRSQQVPERHDVMDAMCRSRPVVAACCRSTSLVSRRPPATTLSSPLLGRFLHRRFFRPFLERGFLGLLRRVVS